MIAYADGLRNIDYFSDVDLPLSNLTRGTNIMFEITLRTKSLVYEELENLDNGNDDE